MTVDHEPSVNDKPIRRKWYLLHLSTWVVILLTIGFVAILELPGETQGTMVAAGDGPSGGGIVYGESFLHGWPWIYLDRYEGVSLAHTFSDTQKAPWLIPRAWKIYSNSESSEFTLIYLILDLFVGSIIILTVAVLFEWRRRLRTRLFQYTLRELLLLMLLTACVLSWWQMHHLRRIREQKFVNRYHNDTYPSIWHSNPSIWYSEYKGPRILAKLFGTALLSDFWYVTEYDRVLIQDKEEFKESLFCLKDFPDLEKIRYNSDEDKEYLVENELLQHISTLKNIEELVIPNSKITNSGMEIISHFSKLKILNLCGNTITSRGVRCLKLTPSLEELNLWNTNIDDAAAETLESLKNLYDLNVAETNLTDNAVPHLGRLSQLQMLDISGTKISEKGYKELKSKLPNCTIFYEN